MGNAGRKEQQAYLEEQQNIKNTDARMTLKEIKLSFETRIAQKS